jgi:hypothetical protein
MKLSDAMRLGAMTGPQLFREMRDDVSGGSCALGAAAFAAGVDCCLWIPTQKLPTEWRWIDAASGGQRGTCPACDEPLLDVQSVILALNDQHRWTREQIADWVATIEPQESQDAGTQTDDVPVAVAAVARAVTT